MKQLQCFMVSKAAKDSEITAQKTFVINLLEKSSNNKS